MRRTTTPPWTNLFFDSWMLGLESASVIWLRMMKLAAGGAAAQSEASRMMSEKITAAVELQMQALTGGLGMTPQRVAAKTVARYRGKVRANRRRLSRS